MEVYGSEGAWNSVLALTGRHNVHVLHLLALLLKNGDEVHHRAAGNRGERELHWPESCALTTDSLRAVYVYRIAVRIGRPEMDLVIHPVQFDLHSRLLCAAPAMFSRNG